MLTALPSRPCPTPPRPAPLASCRRRSLRRLGCNAELIVDEFGEKLLEELDYVQVGWCVGCVGWWW